MEFKDVYSKWLKKLLLKDYDYNDALLLLIRASTFYFGVKEEFRRVDSVNGYFQVSNFGRVYRPARKKYTKLMGTFITKARLFKLCINTDGYVRVCGKYCSNKHNLSVHRMVLEAFVGFDEKYPICNHKDLIRCNNMILNLEWCNMSMNAIHCIENNAHNKIYGVGNPRNIPVVQMDLNGRVLNTFPSGRIAGDELGIDCRHISMNCRGNTKTTHGFVFRFL